MSWATSVWELELKQATLRPFRSTPPAASKTGKRSRAVTPKQRPKRPRQSPRPPLQPIGPDRSECSQHARYSCEENSVFLLDQLAALVGIDRKENRTHIPDVPCAGCGKGYSQASVQIQQDGSCSSGRSTPIRVSPPRRLPTPQLIGADADDECDDDPFSTPSGSFVMVPSGTPASMNQRTPSRQASARLRRNTHTPRKTPGAVGSATKTPRSFISKDGKESRARARLFAEEEEQEKEDPDALSPRLEAIFSSSGIGVSSTGSRSVDLSPKPTTFPAKKSSPVSFPLLSPHAGHPCDMRDCELKRLTPGWVADVEKSMGQHSYFSTLSLYRSTFPQYCDRSCEDAFSLHITTRRYDRTLQQDFDLGKPLGSGTVGTIYLARARRNRQLVVAVKVVHKPLLMGRRAAQVQLEREIENMRLLQEHPNIITLFDWFQTNDHVFMIMEWAPGGDLYTTLTKKRKFTEMGAANVMRQATLAIEACHAIHVLHRDIKPENFVWGCDGRLKLIDFGWSAPCRGMQRRRTLCGTLDYLPPELVLGETYNGAMDRWCLGVLLFELIHGYPPFEHEDVMLTKMCIRDVDFVIEPTVSVGAADLIACILRREGGDRITFGEILSHPWMAASTSVLYWITNVSLTEVPKASQLATCVLQ